MKQAELQSIMQRIRSGDAESFAALYALLGRQVYAVAYRITQSREQAEDITQEIFLRIWRKPPDETVRKPRAWIFRMTQNLAIDAVRRQNPEPLPETVPAEQPDLLLRTALRQALGTLTAEERTAVLLRTDAELSFAEIADAMHCSLPAAYRCWRRALKQLRAALEEGERT
jgi:RNA polymerase sigma-70 factor (ECF subfamily)